MEVGEKRNEGGGKKKRGKEIIEEKDLYLNLSEQILIFQKEPQDINQ